MRIERVMSAGIEKSSFMRPCVFARGASRYFTMISGGRTQSIKTPMTSRSPKRALMIRPAPEGYHSDVNHGPKRDRTQIGGPSAGQSLGKRAMTVTVMMLLMIWKNESLIMIERSFSPCERWRSTAFAKTIVEMITTMWPNTMSRVCASHKPNETKKFCSTPLLAIQLFEVTMFVPIRIAVPMIHKSRMITLTVQERARRSQSENCRFSHRTSSGSGARSTLKLPPKRLEKAALPLRRPFSLAARAA